MTRKKKSRKGRGRQPAAVTADTLFADAVAVAQAALALQTCEANYNTALSQYQADKATFIAGGGTWPPA